MNSEKISTCVGETKRTGDTFSSTCVGKHKVHPRHTIPHIFFKLCRKTQSAPGCALCFPTQCDIFSDPTIAHRGALGLFLLVPENVTYAHLQGCTTHK